MVQFKLVKILLITFQCYITSINCEVFTSITDMENVIKFEQKLIEIFDRFIIREENKLMHLIRYLMLKIVFI